MYLKASQNGSILLTSTLGTTDSESYKSCNWRIADLELMGSSSTSKELKSNFSITCKDIDLGDIANQIINKSPSNAIWSSTSDFTYTTSTPSKVSILNDQIKGESKGIATVTATHKVTGLTKSFSFSIHPGTFNVSIFASRYSIENVGAGSIAGHGWIEITSNSAYSYDVGHYTLQAGESVSIGRWGSQIDTITDGSFVGVWYNRELYEYHINGKYSSYVYTVETVDKSTIDQLSNYILSSYEGYNLALNNCVHFAIEAWNTCVPSSNTISTSLVAPNQLANAIESFDVYYNGHTYFTPETILCGFYNGSSYISHNIPNY